jgi:hypothetical protein
VRAFRDLGSDRAQPDDRHRLSMQHPRPIVGQLVLNPSAVVLCVESSVEPTRQNKQSAHDMLGHRNRLHTSRVGDDDSARGEIGQRQQSLDGSG